MRSSRILQLLSIILLLPFALANATVLKVGDGGQYHSVSEAIQAAVPGDTIFLLPGMYTETPIVIPKSLVLLSNGDAVIDAGEKSEAIVVTADSVVIRKITVRNVGVSFLKDNAAIRLEKVRYCVVDSCTLLNNFFGIYAAESAFCAIQNNRIRARSTREVVSGNGIHLWYCKAMVICGNEISGHRDGIYFEFVQSSEIANNRSERNIRYGLHFMFSDSCRYRGNIFRYNGAGVAVMYTRNVVMEENLFERNWGISSYGLLLKEIYDCSIRKNRFFRNSIGIHIEGSNRLRIEENEFIANGWATVIMANSEDCIVTRNNFIGNTFDVSTNSKQNFNQYIQNFWDKYRGYDLDHNGIGDVPFYPVRLFSLLVQQNPPLLILLRSFFVELLDIAEQIFPVLTPETLVDRQPLMEPMRIQ